MKKALIVGFAAASALFVGAAHANRLNWSVGIDLPPVHTVVSNGPVYHSAPGYYAAPSYYPAPSYYYPAPAVVYRHPAPVYVVPRYRDHYAPVVVYRPSYGGYRSHGWRDGGHHPRGPHYRDHRWR